MARIAVVGGGISGIAVSYFLTKAGHSVEVFEQSETIGGRVGSAKLDGRSIDFGGKNIGRRYPLFREFVREQGAGPYEYFGVNSSQIVNGKLVTLSRERNAASLGNLMRLAGLGGFLRLMLLVRRVRSDSSNGALGSQYFNSLADKCDDKPLTAYFSSKVCEHILRPLVVRMNGAEPEEYYMGNLGTNIKMAFDKYDQLTEGMGRVLGSFASGLSFIRYSTKVSGIVVQEGRVRGLVACGREGEREMEFDGVVLAVPAPAAADILRPLSPAAAVELDNVRYFPVAVAIVRYAREVFNTTTRALVFGRNCPVSNAGAYGVNDLDLVRYTFSGKVARQMIRQETEPLVAIEIAEGELSRAFPVSADLRRGWVYRYFENGLCAYSPRHYQLLQRLQNALRPFQGLAVAGDFIRGASIETCFAAGREAAASVIGHS